MGGGGGGGKGGKGGSGRQRVTRYKLSIHYGICAGPVDSLLALWYNEKQFWSGEVSGRTAIGINNPGAFGGDLQEGGAVGTAHFLPGASNQTLPIELAARLGQTPETCPGFRSIASIFFHGSSDIQQISTAPDAMQQEAASLRQQIAAINDSQAQDTGYQPGSGSESYIPPTTNGPLTYEQQQQLRTLNLRLQAVEAEIATYPTYPKYMGGTGFYWTANSPYIRGIWATVKRIPRQLDAATAAIPNPKDGSGARPDANPAHIIYECLINDEWGMGASPSIIDTLSFTRAAKTLFDEGFGLSMMWTAQAAIETYISEVLDHIEAALFISPSTGLFTLKLIRGDYDIAGLEVFDPSNCVVTSQQTKLFGETINEVVVTWTNPENEQEETYTLQDLGNISAQGAVVSDSRNYYGVRSLDLAKKLAARDLRAASTPLKTVEISVNRKGWKLTPAEVFILHWPEEGIERLVMRITKIDYGRPGQSVIKVSAIEDVYGYSSAIYGEAPRSEWVDTSEPPRPIDFARVVTLPSYVVRRVLGSVTETWTYPSVMAGVLASHVSQDATTYDLLAEAPLANGTMTYGMLSRRPVIGRGTLQDVLTAGAESLVPSFGEVVGGFGPQEGSFIWISPDGSDERNTEIALVAEVRPDGYLLWRGCLDTVPRAWPSGTPCWFVNSDSAFVDYTERAAEVVQNYKLLTNTSLGQLSPDAAPVLSAKLSARPHLPLRPANVQVEGSAFSRVSVPTTATEVVVTWANRNRSYEDSQVLRWDTPSVPPEPGQTTSVYIYNPDGLPLAGFDDLTGTSFSVPITAFGNNEAGSIAVFSKMNGMESFQGARIPITLVPPPRLTINGVFVTINGNRIAMGGDSVTRLVIDGSRLRIAGKRIIIPPQADGTLRIGGDFLTINRQRVLML